MRVCQNELKRVGGVGAEYRADMEAGITLGLVWHLPIAKRVTRDRGPGRARGHFPNHERTSHLTAPRGAGIGFRSGPRVTSSRSQNLLAGPAATMRQSPRAGRSAGGLTGVCVRLGADISAGVFVKDRGGSRLATPRLLDRRIDHAVCLAVR